MHIGAVTFIHRFDSALNEQVHVHVCVAKGVFQVAADDEEIKPKNCSWTTRNPTFVAVGLRCGPVSDSPAVNVSNVDLLG